jgi:hypothetical protein
MAVTKSRPISDFPARVCLKGVDPIRGGVKGFEADQVADAKQDAADRNAKAAEMGIKARYEVVTN